MGIQELMIETVRQMHNNKLSYRESARMFQRQLVISAMERNEWSTARTCRELRMSANTVNKWVREARRQRKEVLRADGVIEYRKRIVVQAGERFPVV